MTDSPSASASAPAFDEAAALADIYAEASNPVAAVEDGRAEAALARYGLKPNPIVAQQFAARIDREGLKASTLPPNERAELETRLRQYAPGPERDAWEDREVRKLIEARTAPVRLERTMARIDNAVANESAQIALEVQEAYREIDRLNAELAEVARHHTERDPKTGEVKAVPVLKHQGPSAKARHYRLQELVNRITMLEGPERRQRLEAAEQVELEKRRAKHRAATLLSQSSTRADAKLLEEEIERRAQAIANARRNFN